MKLSVENLNSHYGPAHILFDVSLQVGAGEAVALLGRNGEVRAIYLGEGLVYDARHRGGAPS